MIRILQIGLTGAPGGIESCVLNYAQHIDHSRFIFDYADIYGNGIASMSSMRNRIEALGGKIYSLTDCRTNLFQFSSDLVALLQKTSYDIIHIHMISAARIILPLICCTASKASVIVHCHNASTPSGMLRKSLHFTNKHLLQMMPVQKWACGIKAGEWMWGKRFESQNVIYNAIECDKFEKNKDVRKAVRTQCGFQDDNIVLGFVGHLCEQKNVLFLPEILAELIKKKACYRLLIVGDGDYRERFLEKIEACGVKKFVFWAGMQSDAAPWYQAMDLFVLPSLFEGLPTVGIEAQASGLSCFVSDTVTQELNITNTVQYLPIDHGAEIWARAIHDSIAREKNAVVFPKNYNIRDAVKNLEEHYLQLISK